MKFSILIPHYDEGFEIIKPLLDSIAIQQNIDFSTLEVVIADDAKGRPLSKSRMNGYRYPFTIRYTQAEIPGVSAARNAALDAAQGDYVMFCDADDMFCNVCGLWIIYREIDNGGFDSLVSTFIEETRLPDKSVNYINHSTDSTFVHGKVHRRQYLLDNKIRWNNNLTIHEDSFFNIQCQNLSTNVKFCSTPFYLWKWRDNSVCRHDPKYILKTYNNMIDSNDALLDEFIKRGVMDKALIFCATLIFDAYYMMNKPEWINQENQEYRDKTEKRFAKYFKKRKELWDTLTPQDKVQISNIIRSRTVMEGMMMEAVTIDTWLKHIEEIEEG